MAIRTWTDDRVERLQHLWREGLSASEIARTLGGVTRNAVIGKVHRLRLGGGRAATPARLSKPRRPEARRSASPRPGRRPDRSGGRILVSAIPEPPGRVNDLMQLHQGMCRWPIGDPKAPDFSFCGAPCQDRYCQSHRQRACHAIAPRELACGEDQARRDQTGGRQPQAGPRRGVAGDMALIAVRDPQLGDHLRLAAP